MQFHKLTPNLLVADIAASIDFYCNVLGFQQIMTVPETPPFDWAMLQHGEVMVMLQSRQSLGDELPELQALPGGGALLLYINVDDVDGLYAAVKDKMPVRKGLEETFYGMREFSVTDPDGFLLTFAQETRQT